MKIRVFEENPEGRKIASITEMLERGGVVVYPTDTVYALGCDILAQKAIEKIARHKGLNPDNPDASLIFQDMSQLSEYTVVRDNNIFKLLKRNLPGPFTFILKANNQIPKMFRNRKKTVGVRIPDSNIALEIVRQLGRPIMTTSVRDDDDVIEYTTDPELIYERYRDFADMVVDAGYGHNVPSTVVDCTGDEPVIVRQGIGKLEW